MTATRWEYREAPPRKLEVIEKELKRSKAGCRVLKIIEDHVEEVIDLVNHNRPTTVIWQRNHGPKFIRAIVDSLFEENVKIPQAIENISLSDLLLRMAGVLQHNGSPELRRTIAEHSFRVLSWAQDCESLPELFERIHGETIEG